MPDEIVKTIYNDACLRAEYLSKIYLDRVATGGVKVVRTKSMDHEREAQWWNTDLATLRSERDKAVDECRAEQGLPKLNRRFAMLAGSRRVPPRTLR